MRFGKWIALAAASSLLCSCSLLPQEEEYLNAPTLRAYTQAEYELSYVQYGDVTVTENISCKFLPATTQSLSFPVGGVYYDEIFVEKGDLVQKGQLLAQLDISGLEEGIAARKESVAALERSIVNLEEQRALAQSAQERILAALPPEQAAAQPSAQETGEQYQRQIDSLHDELLIARLRLEEEEAQLEQRRLYAGIDGAVTYVRKIEPGMRSTEGELVINIADASTSVFTGETVNHVLLPEGTEVNVYSNKEYLPAVVVSAQSLGLEEEISERGEKVLYFQLLTPSAALETNDRGTVTLVLAHSPDTLYIEKNALHSVGERTFVYQMDEDGLKQMIDVETGLETAFTVEIVSGLSEGDNVILD
ncbi:MAG: efflux RND transporter periplasmic adaptor subunit [Eubacteriales bacterium]|nr:efflux RND transporter periplasmic adaptor subunit [Eubacteriales bacterium]